MHPSEVADALGQTVEYRNGDEVFRGVIVGMYRSRVMVKFAPWEPAQAVLAELLTVAPDVAAA